MALSDVDICNRALLRIGHKQPIAALDAPGEAAALCNVLYGQCRDEALAVFPWPFATKRVVLAPLSYTRSGWQHAFAAPTDMLQAQYLFGGSRRGAPIATLSPVVEPVLANFVMVPLSGVGQEVPFEVELSDDGSGRIILSDQSAPELVYTAQVTNPTAFPPLFVDCLSWKLASELALGLPMKQALADYANKRFEMALARAGAQAFRESKEDVQPDSETIAARG